MTDVWYCRFSESTHHCILNEKCQQYCDGYYWAVTKALQAISPHVYPALCVEQSLIPQAKGSSFMPQRIDHIPQGGGFCIGGTHSVHYDR